MNSNKRKEIELLTSICKRNEISPKLAQNLIQSAKKFSYENVSQGTRVKELQELIEFYSK